MAKMHELLSVESSVVSNYNRDFEETLKVFGRADLFTRTVTKKEYFDESDASKLNTTETKEITTTVSERLKWFRKPVSKFFDFVLQKDLTNQKSTADIEVDGKVLASGIPATTLLMLETKLQDMRKVLNEVPTLPAGFIWETDAGQGLYRSKEPKITFSSKNTPKAVVLYEATKEHPAQVKEVNEAVPVAKVTVETYSGMLTSGQKADMLGRLDTLLQAVKKARQRANLVDVQKADIGETLVNYIYGDVVK